jgi:uncharacterized protein YjbJ (UPF0337 family)
MRSSTKDIAEGKMHQVKGKLKEAVGKTVGNRDLKAEGKDENLDGKVQEKIGQIKKKEYKMKLTNQSIAFLFTMLIAAVISMAGCASTGIQRSGEAMTTMQTMDDDIKLIVVQLDATGASLDQLMKTGQSDVRMAFDLYTDNISKFEKMEKDFANHADEMQARGKDYFEEWQKEGNKYKNPQIQELSEQRRIELEEIYGRIAKNSIGAKDAFKAYVSDAKEIQIYLSNDLTSNGIEAIRPISSKLVDDGDNFKYAIKNIQTAIERARAEMSQSGIKF